jgi:hypothetical protein
LRLVRELFVGRGLRDRVKRPLDRHFKPLAPVGRGEEKKFYPYEEQAYGNESRDRQSEMPECEHRVFFLVIA